MKKVININFQGRVIPIEETAYEQLKRYVESLSRYFDKEEGKEEIINDIEGRIGELFAERLHKGATCITDADVESVIAGMGRPEDFEAEEGEVPSSSGTSASASTASPSPQRAGRGRGSFYRNADDQIVGGVCSGLASYLRIDPVITRIIFVVLFGLLFWVYVLLWVIVPSRSVQANITKRLYRNPDQKVIGGVCGGLASYFKIEVWIPRLVFMFPFFLALVSTGFHSFWWNWNFGFMPRVVSGSFGWTFFLTYIILWIAVPQASSSAEKLEMKGEKVDMNSIANSVKEDLQQGRENAESGDSGLQTSGRARSFASEVGQVARRSSSGIGNIIRILFRIFFILAFAAIALILFGIFIAFLFGGIALAPLKGFVLDGPLQNMLAWLTLFLFFLVPLLAFITWSIRRMIGARSRKHYIGIAFAALWLAGLISGIVLIAMVASNYKSASRLEEEPIAVIQPPGTLVVDVERTNWKNQSDRMFGLDRQWPTQAIQGDSMMLSTVQISMVKSEDSAFHVYRIRSSRGAERAEANSTAEKIHFDLHQEDSSLILPKGFFISREDKFRNQRVWIVFEVPVGKKISFSKGISVFHRFRMGHYGYGFDGDDWHEWNYMHRPSAGKEYEMQADGKPKPVKKTSAPVPGSTL